MKFFNVGVLIVSDTCAKNNTLDKTLPEVALYLEKINETKQYHDRKFKITNELIVPDNIDEIQNIISKWTAGDDLRLILTCGGTGFTTNDNTPEAIRPLIEKEAPGIVHAMLSGSLKITPFAIMSRPVAGVKNKSLIITLPGSPKAAKENLDSIIATLSHALVQIENKDARALHKKMNRTLNDEKPDSNMDDKSHHNSHHNHHHGHAHHNDHKHHHAHKGCGIARHKLISNEFDAPVTQRARQSPYPIISVDEAFKKIADNTPSSELINMLITDPKLVGSVIAETIYSKNNVPNFRASIVDGYAVCSSDGPGTYPVVYMSHASKLNTKRILYPGEISRITTGAPIPEGADAVIMVEETQLVSLTEDEKEEKEVLILARDVKPGDNIREIGSDLKKGTKLFEPGMVISGNGGEVGLLASIGIDRLLVHEKPRIGILSTGDELKNVSDCGELKYGEIYDSNKPVLSSIIKSGNFDCVDLGIAGDSKDSLEELIFKAFENDDLDYLITTGGVSMGEMDLLKPTIERVLGGIIHFGRVKMKPGKPTTFATLEHKGKIRVIFALPGNPASASVCYYLFVLPSILKFQGLKPSKKGSILPSLPQIKVKLSDDFKLDSARPEYQRVNIIQNEMMEFVAMSTGFQRSSRIGSFQGANGLVFLPSAADYGDTIMKSDSVMEAMLIGNL